MTPVAHDFLVEIGTEELPPKSLPELSDALTGGILVGLAAAGLKHGAVHSYAAPRRLAVLIEGLAPRQADHPIERKGPPVTAAFGADGAPTRAAEAFAKSCGVTIGTLSRVTEPKGEFLHFSGVQSGQATPALLPGIVQKSLDALPVAKRMRWGDGDAEFVRPVHWVVMLYGRDIVPCNLFGLPAGNVSHGHRFHAPRQIRIPSPRAYAERLEKSGRVIASFTERRDRIRSGVVQLATSLGGKAVLNDALLDEVTALVEWPAPVAGRFEERFLTLPPEVVIATVQDHQRYFPVRDASGALTPWFVTVANIDSRDPEQVRAGNERVVRPRLTDAAFFWDQDRKQTLAARRSALGAVTFQKQLGSVLAKTHRVAALAEQIAPLAGADASLARHAAELAKCDLLSAMVGEFPELQGLMGRYYALHDGEDAEVAAAIEEQYRPRFAGDALPETGAGTAVAIADKLDTLVSIFAAGQRPTGTRDPFGLRRAALGMLRILIEKRIDIELPALIATALEAARTDMIAAGGKTPVSEADVGADVYDYVMERLRAHYLEAGAGFTTEMFDAALARRPSSPLDFDARLRALSAFLALPDAASLASANKRIANILRKAGQEIPARVDAGLLKHHAEQRLASELEAIRGPVEALFGERRYEDALKRLAELRPHVDKFFDEVLVMDENPSVRANRLALLAALERTFGHAADLSRLPG